MPANERLSVLLITRNFPPLLGGMERLNLNMARELARYGEVRVIAPAGSAAHAPAGVQVIEVAGGSVGRFLLGAMARGLILARRSRPDVVLAGSGLTAPMAWLAARLSGARAAVYLHGLDIVVDHALYRALWRPFFQRMDYVIVNSRATRSLAEQAGVPVGRIHVVPPGVNLPPPLSAAERAAIARGFRQRHGLGEGPVLLSVGRLTARKGLLEFVRDVLPLVVEKTPDARLAVIGDVPVNALAARFQTPEQIYAAAREVGVEDRIHFLGKVSEDELKAAYYAADVLVFPLREIPGDPEGFGMVAVEAAAHGLPTVAYATGGVVDAVEEGVSGRLVAPGDARAFADRVCELLAQPILPRAAVRGFAEGLTWRNFGQQVRAVLDAGAGRTGAGG